MAGVSIGVAVIGAGMAGRAHAAGYRAATTAYCLGLPGAEMDPCPLFWQGIDPVLAVNTLDGLVRNAAAKDTCINEAAKINGVLDRHTRVAPAEPGAVSLGGRYTLSRWAANYSWDFVAVARGHEVAWWREFLQALERVDPDMAVEVEHEDRELDQMAGLRTAAETLPAAAGRS